MQKRRGDRRSCDEPATGGPVALVAHSSSRHASALSRTLRRLGYRVVRALTPLEVLHHLEGSRSAAEDEIGTILIGADLGDTSGVDLARFLAEAYPRVRRVLVVATDHRRASRAAAGTVHTVLSAPWDDDRVRAALQGAAT